MKRLSIVVSMVAALGLAAVASAPATAQQHHNKKQVVVKKTVVHKNVVRTNRAVVHSNARRYQVGHSYNGHVWYGHSRHRWHGQWYAYGVGPCWINVEGEWFWNIAACPP